MTIHLVEITMRDIPLTDFDQLLQSLNAERMVATYVRTSTGTLFIRPPRPEESEWEAGLAWLFELLASINLPYRLTYWVDGETVRTEIIPAGARLFLGANPSGGESLVYRDKGGRYTAVAIETPDESPRANETANPTPADWAARIVGTSTERGGMMFAHRVSEAEPKVPIPEGYTHPSGVDYEIPGLVAAGGWCDVTEQITNPESTDSTAPADIQAELRKHADYTSGATDLRGTLIREDVVEFADRCEETARADLLDAYARVNDEVASLTEHYVRWVQALATQMALTSELGGLRVTRPRISLDDGVAEATAERTREVQWPMIEQVDE